MEDKDHAVNSDVPVVTHNYLEATRIVSASGQYFPSKTRDKKTGRDRKSDTKLVIFQGKSKRKEKKKQPNKATVNSPASWWVAHLHSYHGNSRPHGEGFRLNPSGQCLIEWLSGCKTHDDV